MAIQLTKRPSRLLIYGEGRFAIKFKLYDTNSHLTIGLLAAVTSSKRVTGVVFGDSLTS